MNSENESHPPIGYIVKHLSGAVDFGNAKYIFKEYKTEE
jgi:hypothetical protein